jgi:amino acid transporter
MSETLKRRIGPWLLTAYGVGVMVGAGIYVLVGAVAGAAGIWAPLAFLLAGLIAAPTALSYAEFSTRLPEAAGEAAYVGAGQKSRALAMLVNLALILQKRRAPDAPFRILMAVPVVGLILSSAALMAAIRGML